MASTTTQCRCGCGELIKPGQTWIKGHNMRGKFTGRSIFEGHKHTEETKAKLRASTKAHWANGGHAQPEGEAHGNWTGDRPIYTTLHKYAEVKWPKTGFCTDCGNPGKPHSNNKTGTEWANITGDYVRDEYHFAELCIPCHRAMDRSN